MKIILPVVVALVAAFAVILILWTRRAPQTKNPGISQQQAADQIAVQSKLRMRLLQGSPYEFGIDTKSIRNNVWGVIMETAFPDGTATLLCLCDGTTSLYLGQGGGIIGGEAHEAVRAAGQIFVAMAADSVEGMTRTDTYPMPETGRVRFYVLTSSGVSTVDEDEQSLGEGRHKFSQLFHAGHEVITQLRRTTEHDDNSREEIDALLQEGIKTATYLLEKNGEFYPFGLALQRDGTPVQVATWAGNEHPKSNDVLQLLCQGLKTGVQKGDYTAVAIITDVKIRKSATDEARDALRIHIEHPQDAPVACYLPYHLDAGKVVHGELTAERCNAIIFETRR